MSRDYTLRLLQSNSDRTKNNRKKGKKSGTVQSKSLKKLKPLNTYNKKAKE